MGDRKRARNRQTDPLPSQIEEREERHKDNAKVLKPVAGAVSGENFPNRYRETLRKIWLLQFTLTQVLESSPH